MRTASHPRAIGPYLIEKPLGAGGMAEVFLGVKPGLDGKFRRLVAVKRILPQYMADEAFRARFEEEARLVAQFRHPHIVAAVDSGEDEGLYYLAMEWIEGTDLSRLLRWCQRESRPLPLVVVAHVAYAISSALSYVHDDPFCVVHRDISPQNILIGTRGEVKLSDFGISQFPGRNHQTRTNMLKGKMAYMSPEQLQAEGSTARQVDHRSDLFSLGTVLYQMLTGRNPFANDGFYAQAQAVLKANEVEGYEAGLRDAPEALACLVRQLHMRDPARRPQATDDVVSVLRAQQVVASDLVVSQLVREWQVRTAGATPSHEFSVAQSAPAVADVSSTTGSTTSSRAAVITEDLEEQDLLSTNSELACIADATSPSSTSTSVFGPRSMRSRGAMQQPELVAARPSWALPALAGALTLLAVAGLLLALGAIGALRWPNDVASPAVAAPPPGAWAQKAPPPLPSPTTPPPPRPREDDATGLSAAAPPAVFPAATSVSADDRIPSERAPVAEGRARSAASSSARRSEGNLPSVRVVVRPWGRVWLDGRLIGQAPLDATELEPGPHRIEVGIDEPAQAHIVDLHSGKTVLAYELE